MPSKEQRETTRSQIEDVIGRRYIEGDGDMCGCRYAPEGGGNVGVTYCHPPEPGQAVPFADLDEASQVELLTTYVAWEGFDFLQDGIVIRNVLDRRPPGEWMDGIDQKALHAELRADAHSARERDYGVDDAATYAQRVAEGADTVRNLEGSHEKAACEGFASQGERAPKSGMSLTFTPKNAKSHSRTKQFDIDLDR